MLYPQTATVNHSYIEGSLLVDKVLKKHLMILEKSNLELTEKKGRLQYVHVEVVESKLANSTNFQVPINFLGCVAAMLGLFDLNLLCPNELKAIVNAISSENK